MERSRLWWLNPFLVGEHHLTTKCNIKAFLFVNKPENKTTNMSPEIVLRCYSAAVQQFSTQSQRFWRHYTQLQVKTGSWSNHFESFPFSPTHGSDLFAFYGRTRKSRGIKRTSFVFPFGLNWDASCDLYLRRARSTMSTSCLTRTLSVCN